MIRPLVLSALCVVLAGCDWMPGKPVEARDKWRPPTAVVDFKTLYAENCQGCHGDGTTVSGAISLNNPAYLAVVPKTTFRQIVANGIPGTMMPPFSTTNGGMLTEQQIDILVDGIFAWAKPLPMGVTLPSYAAAPGDAANGETLYAAYQAAVEKSAGPQMLRDGFMTNPAFLGLVSDQYLRTLILAGRPELGIADFRTVIPGRPLSDSDIADIVAWLISQRKNEFGQPLTPGQR